MTEKPKFLEGDPGITLENAMLLADAAHAGQLDRGDGSQGIRHPIRVMAALEPYGEKAQVTGVFNDVVEDTGITLDDLKKIGVSDDVIDAVDAISIRPDEEYTDYLVRVMKNPLARLGKMADNRDNANKKRKAQLPASERVESTRKYEDAFGQLIEGDEWLARQVPMIQARIEALFDAEQSRDIKNCAIPMFEAALLIESAWKDMNFRPVAVAAIRDQRDRVLLVESAKHPGEWGLIQGGIDPEEGLISALRREVHEEAGIRKEELEIGELTDVVDLEIPPGHSDKRGFTRGKRYFVVQAKYTGSNSLSLDRAELNNAVWVDTEDIPPFLKGKRPEKRGLIERALS